MIDEIEINKIKAGDNPRLNLNESNLGELMADISKYGLLHPVGVIKEKEEYILVYGNRRLEACKKLGFKTIRASIILGNLTKEELIGINASENIHRVDMTPVEFGSVCLKLRELGLNREQIADRLSVSLKRVKIALSLSKKVPIEFINEIKYAGAGGYKESNTLSSSCADAILKFKLTPEDTRKILLEIKEKGLGREDAQIIKHLIDTGLSVEKAIKERANYDVKQLQLVVDLRVFKEMEKKEGNLIFKEYIRDILQGRKQINKNLVI